MNQVLHKGAYLDGFATTAIESEPRDALLETMTDMLSPHPLGECAAGLERADVSETAYYEWQSRSGCTVCFFQQKVERVRLSERHPRSFAEAVDYEKTALRAGLPFTWSQGESLTERINPARVAQIKEDYEQTCDRFRHRPFNRLADPDAPDDVYGVDHAGSTCVTCHK